VISYFKIRTWKIVHKIKTKTSELIIIQTINFQTTDFNSSNSTKSSSTTNSASYQKINSPRTINSTQINKTKLHKMNENNMSQLMTLINPYAKKNKQNTLIAQLNENTTSPTTQVSQLNTQDTDEESSQWTSIQTKRSHKTSTTQVNLAFSSVNPFAPLSELCSTNSAPLKKKNSQHTK
jgi:hypothetical protein